VKEEAFFLKKEAKTFIQLAWSAQPQNEIDKVFLLLFVHKKKILSNFQPIDFAHYRSGPTLNR